MHWGYRIRSKSNLTPLFGSMQGGRGKYWAPLGYGLRSKLTLTPLPPASQLLWRGPTSPRRASSASAHRFPDAGRIGLRRRSTRRPPGSRTRSVHTCQGLRPRGADRMLAITHAIVWPSADQTASAPRSKAFAAQWLAYMSPYRRFAPSLAAGHARLGADVDRYSFIVVDLHHLLLAGLPAHLTPLFPFFQLVISIKISSKRHPGQISRTHPETSARVRGLISIHHACRYAPEVY